LKHPKKFCDKSYKGVRSIRKRIAAPRDDVDDMEHECVRERRAIGVGKGFETVQQEKAEVVAVEYERHKGRTEHKLDGTIRFILRGRAASLCSTVNAADGTWLEKEEVRACAVLLVSATAVLLDVNHFPWICTHDV
jgi:hypothetical protein